MRPEVAPGAQHALTIEKRLRLTHGYADVYRHASDIEPEFWATAFADTPKDFHYYQLLEQTMRRYFDYRYLLVCDEADRPRALQPIILATQDLAASAGEKFARLVAKLRRRFARFFQSRMALAGCLVGEGKTGLIRSDETVLPMVAEALEQFARSEKIGLFAFKDFPVATREVLSF